MSSSEEALEEDELVVIPAHFSKSLQSLEIIGDRENIVVHPFNAFQALNNLGLENCEFASFSSTCCPLPSSLQYLSLEGFKCLKTLSMPSLTSLTALCLQNCGGDLRCKDLLHLLTQGKLSELYIYESPNFFAGWDPTWGLQDEERQLLLSHPSKLRILYSDDFAGVLVPPICRLISSSIIELNIRYNDEVEYFTKVQEESLHLLTSLQELSFLTFGKLCRLPAGLHKLNNLKILDITECPALRLLPMDSLPSSLQGLYVNYCSEELKQQCRQLVETIPRIRLSTD